MVRVMRVVGGVCEICIFRAVWAAMGQWIKLLGLCGTTPVERGGVLDVGLCLGCGGVGGVLGEFLGM